MDPALDILRLDTRIKISDNVKNPSNSHNSFSISLYLYKIEYKLLLHIIFYFNLS